MKLAIMQPYLFPYLGYFQLVDAVDRFVFYDDVNYIKGGWINRNRLLLGGGVSWFTIPLNGASPHKKINEVRVQPDDMWRRKLLASVRHGYSRAPYFRQAHSLLEEILQSGETSLSELACTSIVSVSRYLGLEVQFVHSAGRYGNEALSGSARILDICRQEGATEYHNLPGGEALYSPDSFRAAGIELRFVQCELDEYRQFGSSFQSGLSILDVLMFNDPMSTRQLLKGTDSA